MGLCLCPSKGILVGMDPYCSSGVPRALHSGWLHSGAAASRHRDPAASEAQHPTARHAILCRVRVVLDLRLRTLKRLMAHWVLHACAEVQKNTSITTKACRHRHQGLRRESLASTSMARSSMTPRWNKRSHRRKRTSSSITTTTMTMLRIPRTQGDSCCRSIHSCCRSI